MLSMHMLEMTTFVPRCCEVSLRMVERENASWCENEGIRGRFMLHPKEFDYGYVWDWMKPQIIMTMKGDWNAYS